MTPAGPENLTVDSFLNHRVEALQHAVGHHRSGLEAVILAASLDARVTGTVVDLGAGTGVAGFCAAVRCPHAKIVLVEKNPESVAGARAALARPANAHFADRVRIAAADITAPEAERAEAGIGRDLADHVLLNPPFHHADTGTASPATARAEAHVLDPGGLDSWFRAATSLLKVRGDVTVIFRADGLDRLLDTMRRRFGGLDILPIQPRAGAVAHRVLIRAIKGSRAGLRILPPLVLHGEVGNAFLPPVEAMLREGRGLASVVRTWHGGRGRPS